VSGNIRVYDKKMQRKFLPHINLCNVECPVIAKQLLREIDVNRKDHDGSAPLHYVRDAKITQIFIDAGADVHVEDSDGLTPLHSVNNIEIAEVLIQAGADINARDRDGFRPLHYAKNYAIQAFLIENGGI
jgi:ankyrin repeat protein